uniref:Uncharacterized protein n=1 Tax=Glossina palpalis gambiensis TaxID=67801 RepID=A0A1B0AUJ4_9MUSC
MKLESETYHCCTVVLANFTEYLMVQEYKKLACFTSIFKYYMYARMYALLALVLVPLFDTKNAHKFKGPLKNFCHMWSLLTEVDLQSQGALICLIIVLVDAKMNRHGRESTQVDRAAKADISKYIPKLRLRECNCKGVAKNKCYGIRGSKKLMPTTRTIIITNLSERLLLPYLKA